MTSRPIIGSEVPRPGGHSDSTTVFDAISSSLCRFSRGRQRWSTRRSRRLTGSPESTRRRIWPTSVRPMIARWMGCRLSATNSPIPSEAATGYGPAARPRRGRDQRPHGYRRATMIQPGFGGGVWLCGRMIATGQYAVLASVVAVEPTGRSSTCPAPTEPTHFIAASRDS
jgi:hypothetical protein